MRRPAAWVRTNEVRWLSMEPGGSEADMDVASLLSGDRKRLAAADYQGRYVRL